MGADFLCVSLPVCRLTTERKNKLVEIITVTQEEDIEERVIYDSLEEYKQELSKALDEYETAGQDRHVGEWKPEGSPFSVFFTGGLSHGDAPTDAYDYFENLCNHDLIYDKLRVFAIEDSMVVLKIEQ